MPDWDTTIDGDLIFEAGNLKISTEEDAVRADVLFRLQTELFGYEPDPELGVGLDQFIGQPNTREVGNRVQRAVVRSLTRDGKFFPNSVRVEVVPLGVHTLGIYVFVVPRFSGTFSATTVAVSLDLTVGAITEITG